MHVSAYYDSCVFLNARNGTHKQYQFCAAITEPSKINWIVWICLELIAAETTASELVNAFEISCVLNGVIVAHVQKDQATQLAKEHKNHKLKLAKMQLKNRDFLHLMCATYAAAQIFATVDPDFWDAANKSNPKSSKRMLSATKDYIEAYFPIRIMLPSELLASSTPAA